MTAPPSRAPATVVVYRCGHYLLGVPRRGQPAGRWELHQDCPCCTLGITAGAMTLVVDALAPARARVAGNT